MAEPVRCAIYTRKSSEEGLEQAFNSLHAQREACEAYILSQKHEGWLLLPEAYDDGGISGGTIDRPGLKGLLAQVEAGNVDTIVVYKVDRLTRSLADFAKLVELFDRKNVSFVSVTQAFNTTTSMGRLTLNVLLSFAQFEREVTGERIRDKIAASKAKGLWMGGTPPLGYDPKDRTLIINPDEAARVELLFEKYLELRSVDELVAYADQHEIRSKSWTTAAGRSIGGQKLLRGAIYHILANPVYVGEISHRGTRHPGQHPPILSRELFDKVQARLDEQRRKKKLRGNAADASPLAGIIFTADGARLTPTHTCRRGRRYRYYASADANLRVSANLIEQQIKGALIEKLGAPDVMAPLLAGIDGALVPRLDALKQVANGLQPKDAPLTRAQAVAVIERVVIGAGEIELTLRPDLIGADVEASGLKISIATELTSSNRHLSVIGGKTARRTSPSVLTMFAQARIWFEELVAGTYPSIAALAKAEDVTPPYVSNVLDLAFVATFHLNAVFDGSAVFTGTMADLKTMPPVPIFWSEQDSLGLVV